MEKRKAKVIKAISKDPANLGEKPPSKNEGLFLYVELFLSKDNGSFDPMAAQKAECLNNKAGWGYLTGLFFCSGSG